MYFFLLIHHKRKMAKAQDQRGKLSEDTLWAFDIFLGELLNIPPFLFLLLNFLK